jgi:hypothetical protein
MFLPQQEHVEEHYVIFVIRLYAPEEHHVYRLSLKQHMALLRSAINLPNTKAIDILLLPEQRICFFRTKESAPSGPKNSSGAKNLIFEPLEQQRRVRASEAEAI